MQMNDRERLIELLDDVQDKGINYAKNEDEISCHVSNKNIADCLLKNRVILLPFNIGTELYDAIEFIVEYGNYIFTYGDDYFDYDDIGKSLFLSKEEAEQALKGE